MEGGIASLELRPKPDLDLGDGVDANAVEIVGLHEGLDPVEKGVPDIRDGLVQVGQAGETAQLDLSLVAEVEVDIAVGGTWGAIVVLGGLVEGNKGGVVVAWRGA